MPDLWQYRDSTDLVTQDIDLSGFEVMGPDGALGTVDRASKDVHTKYVVVDTGDWAAGRRVLLPAGTVERVDVPARQLYVDRTRSEVAAAPELDPDDEGDVSFEDTLSGYYHGLYDTGL